jgi:hypothetical protein
MDLLRAFNSEVKFIPKPGRTFDLGDAPCPYMQQGVALIVGTHPCWKEDLEAALAIYPDADLIAVNEAVRLVKAKHLVTAHDEDLHKFVAAHKETWGNDLPMIHVSDGQVTDNGIPKYIWPALVGGGSGPLAAAIALKIGYQLAVLCGCPLNGGGGYAFDTDDKGGFLNPRVGFVSGRHNMIHCWHNQLRTMKAAEPEIANKIRSMSGFTKELFGGLDGN